MGLWMLGRGRYDQYEQRRTMLKGKHERRGRWTDLNPAVEIASMGEEVGLNQDESYDLLKLLLDEDLLFTRFLRAGDDPRLGQEVGPRAPRQACVSHGGKRGHDPAR